MVWSVLDRIVGLVSPYSCVACGSAGDILCDSCKLSAGEPLPSRCAGCQKLTKHCKTCTSCRSWLPVYSVHVAAPYEGTYEQVLYEYKFESRRQAAQQIAEMMSENMPEITGECIVVHIPTAPSRIRERGFDHAKQITKELMKYLDQDMFEHQGLLRRKSNVRQLGKSKQVRMQQMRDEFYIDHDVDLSDKNILLVDDVVTSGATLAAAAKTLKSAGARRIYSVVYAQKV